MKNVIDEISRQLDQVVADDVNAPGTDSIRVKASTFYSIHSMVKTLKSLLDSGHVIPLHRNQLEEWSKLMEDSALPYDTVAGQIFNHLHPETDLCQGTVCAEESIEEIDLAQVEATMQALMEKLDAMRTGACLYSPTGRHLKIPGLNQCSACGKEMK